MNWKVKYYIRRTHRWIGVLIGIQFLARACDNITNWLLRAFSIFGLATVASGFTLFFISRKRK